MRTILLRVWSTVEDWNPISRVVIQLDVELALRLLALYAEYTALRKREERLSELVFFDYNATYLEEEHQSEEVADLVHRHIEDDVTEVGVPDLIAAKLSGDDDWDRYHASMEVQRLHVTEHGVRWSALVKHTDVEICTAHLDYKLIREVAGL